MALFGSSKSLLGLDIGSSSVKAVELSRSGSGLVISGFGTAPIESPDGVAEAIQRVLNESGIRTKRCVTSVSGRSVIIRQVPIAQVPDTELRQAIEYEADKYIPFDVNEVQLDVQKLPVQAGELPAGQMKVLLVAVKRTLIDEHIALLQSVGLQPTVVDVDVFSLGNAFELRNLSLGIADDTVRALVDIGASKTNINIMRGNHSYFQREIYVAGNDLTEAIAKRFGEDPKDVEKMKKEPGGALESMQDAMLPVLEDIGNEIRLSFDYFENQYDKKVSEVYLSGGTAYFPGMDTMFTQVFNLPTKVWDPTEGLEITGVNPAGMGGANSDMVVALGLASRILGHLGWAARMQPAAATASMSSAASAAVSAKTVSIGTYSAAQSTGERKSWFKALGLGFVAAICGAVGAALFNTAGYTHWWVVGEAIPLGILTGLGLWVGVKALRPIPSRMAIFFNAMLVAVLCCGFLFGVRVVKGDPIVARHKAPPRTATAPPATKRPDLPPELQRKILEQKEKQLGWDVDDVSTATIILTHCLCTGALGMLIVWVKFSLVAQREARQAWSKATTSGSAE